MIEKLNKSLVDLSKKSVYGYSEPTLQELLVKFYNTINQNVEVANTSLNFLTWLVDEGLPKEMMKEINNLQENGILDQIINQKLFTGLDMKIENLQQDINSKITKSSIVNNLLVGGFDKALSAEQGVILNTEVSKKANNDEVRKRDVKIELEDLAPNALSAITGNTNIELNTIPQNDSVSIDKLSQDLGKTLVVPVLNLITNGDFNNGVNGWSNYGTTSTISNQILVNKTNGTTDFGGVIQTTTYPLIKNNKIYLECRVRVTNSVTQNLKILVRGGTVSGEVELGRVEFPVVNQWYTIKGVVPIVNQTGVLKVYVNHYYLTPLLDNSMEIDYFTGIDISTIFGVGKEPTQEEIDLFLGQYNKKWYNGKANWFNAKNVLNIIRKNPLDEFMTIEGNKWGL